MPKKTTSKVTISLPPDLLELADRLAEERSTTRSGVIAGLLEKEERARLEALMEEGYRELAEESQRAAEEAFPLVAETVARYSEWDESREPEHG